MVAVDVIVAVDVFVDVVVVVVVDVVVVDAALAVTVGAKVTVFFVFLVLSSSSLDGIGVAAHRVGHDPCLSSVLCLSLMSISQRVDDIPCSLP